MTGKYSISHVLFSLWLCGYSAQKADSLPSLQRRSPLQVATWKVRKQSHPNSRYKLFRLPCTAGDDPAATRRKALKDWHHAAGGVHSHISHTGVCVSVVGALQMNAHRHRHVEAVRRAASAGCATWTREPLRTAQLLLTTWRSCGSPEPRVLLGQETQRTIIRRENQETGDRNQGGGWQQTLLLFC